MSTRLRTRRELLGLTGARPAQAQRPTADQERPLLPAAGDLVNLLEFDDAARIALDPTR